MKRIILAAALLLGISTFVVPSMQAATVYSCDCDPTNAPCSCDTHRKEIGRSGTVEFHGHCSKSDLNPAMIITDRDGGTSCTVNTNIVYNETFKTGGYSSKSCTNWDPFTTDTVTVRLKCCTEDTRGQCWPGWDDGN